MNGLCVWHIALYRSLSSPFSRFSSLWNSAVFRIRLDTTIDNRLCAENCRKNTMAFTIRLIADGNHSSQCEIHRQQWIECELMFHLQCDRHGVPMYIEFWLIPNWVQQLDRYTHVSAKQLVVLSPNEHTQPSSIATVSQCMHEHIYKSISRYASLALLSKWSRSR